MVKTKCELCCNVARVFCEADQASLCWNCDGKVHGANFLVAKHTRCLLCSACQSPTSWKASHLRLSPTVSICESCVARKNNSSSGRESRNRNLSQAINGRGFNGSDQLREDDGAESYNDDMDEEEEEEEEEEEAENQVVPWDAAAPAAQQPPELSSSSSVSSGDGVLVAKRTRRRLDLNCSDEESNESRALKRLSRDETSSRSTATMNSTTLRLTASDTTSSSSTLVFNIANKSRDLSR